MNQLKTAEEKRIRLYILACAVGLLFCIACSLF